MQKNSIYINNLEDEIRCEHLVTSQVKHLWNAELILAQKLIEVCKKHNIRVFAAGGTALGAVRHHGFIPWDDDMDFKMLRADYDRLLAVADEEFKPPFFFQTTYSDKGFCGGFAKVRLDNTTMLLDFEAECPPACHLGIFIDIFILDDMPDSPGMLQNLIKKKNTILNYHFLRENKYYRFLPDKMLMLLRNTLKLGRRAFFSREKNYAYIEKCARDINSGKGQVCSYLYEYSPKWIIDKEWLKDVVWMPFEQIELPVPIGYDEMLKREYGDYMVFKKGGAMHTAVFVDPHKDYHEFLDHFKVDYFKHLKRSIASLLKMKF